ncbi:MAG: hypothetical protein QXW70_04175 [Candidatus Anstonellales archaeon]
MLQNQFSLRDPQPKYEKIKEYILRGSYKKPKAVFLLTPHANEQKAVFPFRDALATELRKRGIVVKKFYSLDTITNPWKIRKRIGMATGDSISYCNYILTLQDYYSRIKFSYTLLYRTPKKSAIALELHAYDIKKAGEISGELEWVRRLRDTHVFAIKDAYLFLKEQTRKVIDLIEQNIKEVRRIASLVPINVDSIIHYLERIFPQLKKFNRHFLIVEIPATTVFLLNKNSPYHSFFIDGHRLTDVLTEFENNYCVFDRRSMGFTAKEIKAVADILLLPALRIKRD